MKEIIKILDPALGQPLIFNEGELVALFGPNGSGKTTLLRQMAGLSSYRGESKLFYFKKQIISELDPKLRARSLGYLSLGSYSRFGLNVREVVALGRVCHGESTLTASREAIQNALRLVGLEDRKFSEFDRLSAGERARVLFARAIAQDAEVFLVDELLSSMDLSFQVECLKTLKHLCVELHKTAIVVSHDMNLVAPFSDRSLFLKCGKVFKEGPTRQVFCAETVSELYPGVEVKNIVSDIDGIARILFKPTVKTQP